MFPLCCYRDFGQHPCYNELALDAYMWFQSQLEILNGLYCASALVRIQVWSSLYCLLLFPSEKERERESWHLLSG